MDQDGILQLDESAARQLVLVRAIEETDTQGRLVSEIERDQLEREALAGTRRDAGGAVEFGQYLQLRARRVLATVENRNPRIAALQDPEPWRPWLMAGLPIAACVLGAALDRIDNPHQVNMLSPPLLGVLAWNLAIYLVILVSLLLPRGGARRPAALAQRWLGAMGAGRRTGRLHADVLARFHQRWLAVAGRAEWLWWKQLLHLAAAGWALGLAISIVLGGVVREYRVGWESTLLGASQVHSVLQVLFAPVVALLPFEPFSQADVGRMAFRSGAAIGLAEARRWIWLYVALLFVVIVVPRLLLAGWAATLRHRQRRSVRLDLRDPYFVQVLARVSPARITIGFIAQEGRGREAVLRMLRQVADGPPPRTQAPWTVLVTGRGDVLRLFDVPPDFRAPAAAVTAPAGGAAAAQAWLQDLLGRFKSAPRAAEPDAVQGALADTDLMLLAPQNIADLENATRLLHWVAQPAVVLAPSDVAGYRDAVRRLGLAAEVLSLQQCTANWTADDLLLDAAAARLPASKRAGFQRLAAAWHDRHAVRFAEAMRLLAAELVRAARDSEQVGSAPTNLRQLVDPAERDAVQRGREGARAALLRRMRDAEATVLAELVQLHGAGTPVTAVAASRGESGFSDLGAVDTPQAGIAGAATGAAMGAGIDLLTGGLTLGAAAAIGALIGGGAGYAAAAWKNRAAPGGQPQVQAGDELLQSLAENLLLAYLSVAQRRAHEQDAGMPSHWRSEVVAAVEARRVQLEDLWRQARNAADPSASVTALAAELEVLARALLARV
ncbi:MAG: putative rane protein [Ramlibacter sp.]|nr:putative rane protein [Ramlibacter sp.]